MIINGYQLFLTIVVVIIIFIFKKLQIITLLC